MHISQERTNASFLDCAVGVQRLMSLPRQCIFGGSHLFTRGDYGSAQGAFCEKVYKKCANRAILLPVCTHCTPLQNFLHRNNLSTPTLFVDMHSRKLERSSHVMKEKECWDSYKFNVNCTKWPEFTEHICVQDSTGIRVGMW